MFLLSKKNAEIHSRSEMVADRGLESIEFRSETDFVPPLMIPGDDTSLVEMKENDIFIV